MPHFVIDCSQDILNQKSQEEALMAVHKIAVETGLFREQDIKVRMRPIETFLAGGKQQDFIHIFGDIMEGRTTEQKADLSKRMVGCLKNMFPDVNFIAMNVREFEKATYCNLSTLEQS